MEKEDKIKINDKEYFVDSLTEQQKYFLLQARLLEKKVNDANIELAQLRMAMSAFTDKLIQDLKEKDSESTSDGEQQKKV
tara:strand:- start:100 stop:339 length:240 start_codon:yes stop_codon:yes gene_type:complete